MTRPATDAAKANGKIRSDFRLSPEVAAFLLQILNSVQLTVSAANIGEHAALVVRARAELGS